MVYSDIAKAICGFAPDATVTFAMVQAVTHPEDYPHTSAAARRALDPNIRENVVFRYRILRANDGEERWVLAYGEAQFEERVGEVRATRYVGTLQDITEQHLAEQRQAESEARLRLAIDAAQLAVWEVDVTAGTVTGSVELNRLCGFPDDATPTLEEFRSRYAPGEAERMAREAAETMGRGEMRLQAEIHHIWPDGTEKWLLMRAQVVPVTAGANQRVTGVLMDITERKRQEEALSLVSHELRHRIKNSLTVVAALARRAILSKDDPVKADDDFMGRVTALGAATDLAFGRAGEVVDLDELVKKVLSPYAQSGTARVILEGPPIVVPGQLASKLALAVHELSTNALKYGALSVPAGHVSVTWSVSNDELLLRWQEHGGPEVAGPTTPGFGSRLLQRGIFSAPDRATLTYAVNGVRCEIQVRLVAEDFFA
jgi:PAS domain S-box-containing protein